MLLTVNSGGDGFDELEAGTEITVKPGTYTVEFRCGTADGGTLTFNLTKTEIASDTGAAIRDPDATAYSYDLSSVTDGGFVVDVADHGTIVPTIASGADDETLYVFVTIQE